MYFLTLDKNITLKYYSLGLCKFSKRLLLELGLILKIFKFLKISLYIRLKQILHKHNIHRVCK